MKLKVKTPGKMVVVHNKPTRSPVIIDIVNDEQLNFYEMFCRTQSLEYEIIYEDEEAKAKKPELLYDDSEETEPVIEELKTGRLLDELIK